VVAEAARGVDAGHRVGVLHRDLKPANILLTPVSRRALVTDFGLAAPQLFPMAGPDTPGDATVTMGVPAGDGKLVGTPCYMAPEQAHGRAPVRVSDVYGLGATLYALLTGQAPYQPRGLPPRPALDTVLRVREEPPADIREVDPAVPERLARIVRKAMDRDPRQRYPTAAALADDLDAYRAGLPTSLDARRPVLRLGLWARRHRSAVITGAVLSALFVGILGGSAWLAYERRQLLEAVGWADARLLEAQVLASKAQAMERIAQEHRADAEAGAAEALARAEAADAARARALRSESDAEQRWAVEREAREEAQAAQAEAEAARDEAMALAAANEAARRAAEDALRLTEASLADARAASRSLERDLADSRDARARAEASLRRAHLDLVELEEARATQDARIASMEAELARLRASVAELEQLRARMAELAAPPPAQVSPALP
jgi:serine/threonine-protein kinase